jgi:hypothetical protein
MGPRLKGWLSGGVEGLRCSQNLSLHASVDSTYTADLLGPHEARACLTVQHLGTILESMCVIGVLILWLLYRRGALRIGRVIVWSIL